MTVLGVILAIGFLFASWAMMSNTNKRYRDPKDLVVVDLDQLRDQCQLGQGQAYVVFTTRQSGYEHQPRRVFYSIDDAVAAGVTTMRRGKVPFAKITQNSTDRFEFCRPYHDHMGRAEGKKVGSIEIVRVD